MSSVLSHPTDAKPVVPSENAMPPSPRERRSFFTKNKTSFLVSLVIHVCGLLLLGAVVLPSAFDGTLLMSILMPSGPLSDAQLDLTNLEMSDSDLPPMGSETNTDMMGSTNAIAGQLASTLLTLEADGSESGGETSLQLGVSDQVMTAMNLQNGTGKRKNGKGKGTYYFGVEAVGERFVFIIDSSRSMAGIRWDRAIAELTKTAKELGPDQKFTIICFDEKERPLFDQKPVFYPPTKKVLATTSNWLKSLRHGRDTRPASAVRIAMDLAPDSIYVLSDGLITDDTQELLRENNKREDGQPLIPVHTILLYSDDGKEILESIAKENGGTFINVR